MKATSKKLASVSFSFLMIVSVLSVAQLGAAATGDPTEYTITQGENCYEFSTHSDGSQMVEEYYDYRNPENSEGEGNYTYSSWGTRDIQENQESQLFFYNGENGVSLVFVHDQLSYRGDADGSYGSTITFDITGLPNGEWAVEDDNYPGQDDNWNKDGSSAHIDWMWAENRTDGGAYRGLENLEGNITIDPAFNEDAAEWGTWGYSGDENNKVQAWQVVDADGSTQELDMTQSITVSQGSCGDQQDPQEPEEPTGEFGTIDCDESDNVTAEFSASNLNASEEVAIQLTVENESGNSSTLSQSATADENGVIETTVTFDTPENATATHIVASRANSEELASMDLDFECGDEPVEPEPEPKNEPPTANLDVDQTEVVVGNHISLNASASTDDNGVVEYKWDVDGEPGFDDRLNREQIWAKWMEPGEYELTVRVIDEHGEYDETSVTVTVLSDEKDPWVETFDVPDEVTAGEHFVLEGLGRDADSGVDKQYWVIDGETISDSKVQHAFDEPGEYGVKLVVVDNAGNKVVQKTTITATDDHSDDKNSGEDGSDDNNSDNDGSDDNNSDNHNSGSSTTNYYNSGGTAYQSSSDSSDDGESEADIEVTDVELDASSITAGEEVEVTATLENSGSTDGEFTAELSRDGTVLDSETVTVEADATKTVTLTHTFDEAGTYLLDVDGENVELVVQEPEAGEEPLQDEQQTETESDSTSNDDGQPGFGVAAALAALVAAMLLARRR